MRRMVACSNHLWDGGGGGDVSLRKLGLSREGSHKKRGIGQLTLEILVDRASSTLEDVLEERLSSGGGFGLNESQSRGINKSSSSSSSRRLS